MLKVIITAVMMLLILPYSEAKEDGRKTRFLYLLFFAVLVLLAALPAVLPVP